MTYANKQRREWANSQARGKSICIRSLIEMRVKLNNCVQNGWERGWFHSHDTHEM